MPVHAGRLWQVVDQVDPEPVAGTEPDRRAGQRIVEGPGLHPSAAKIDGDRPSLKRTRDRATGGASCAPRFGDGHGRVGRLDQTRGRSCCRRRASAGFQRRAQSNRSGGQEPAPRHLHSHARPSPKSTTNGHSIWTWAQASSHRRPQLWPGPATRRCSASRAERCRSSRWPRLRGPRRRAGSWTREGLAVRRGEPQVIVGLASTCWASSSARKPGKPIQRLVWPFGVPQTGLPLRGPASMSYLAQWHWIGCPGSAGLCGDAERDRQRPVVHCAGDLPAAGGGEGEVGGVEAAVAVGADVAR